MAGTVKAVGSISPRPRARYSSWIEAEPQPRAWEALQMTQRTASRSSVSGLKTASNTSSSMSSSRNRRSSPIWSPASVMVATPSRLARRSSAVEMCMRIILPKGRCERERQQGSNQHAEPGGEQVPVARRPPVGEAAALEVRRPPAHGGEGRHVQQRRKADHADGEGPDVVAVAEGDRAAGRAGRDELEPDDGGGDGEHRRRPGEVRDQRPAAQRCASSPLRRAASVASRRVMRPYSKYRYTQAAAPRPATMRPKATDCRVIRTGQKEPPARLNASSGTSSSTVNR